jgi:hypothetical protein
LALGVSVQKPIAMTLPEWDRVIKAAAASHRRLKAFEDLLSIRQRPERELLRGSAIRRPLHFRMKARMANRAQARHVLDAASRWRHALAAEGRDGPKAA